MIDQHEQARMQSSKPSFPLGNNGNMQRQLVHEADRPMDVQLELELYKLQMDSALAEMGTLLISAIEQERRRIARELHDDLCQRLALLAIGLEQLAQTTQISHEETSSRIRMLWKDTADICSDAGRLSRELHSCKLEQLGLIPTLRGLCSDMSKRHGIEILFTDEGIPQPVPQDIALCLFRIAQEALGNAAKHSKAQVIRLKIDYGSGILGLRVRDEGVGFDPATVYGKGRLGLMSMRERTRSVGGDISIHSRPSCGTEIHVRIPLRHEEARFA
jgi:signal transduction histidine kinase